MNLFKTNAENWPNDHDDYGMGDVSTPPLDLPVRLRLSLAVSQPLCSSLALFVCVCS